ncbi:hypothetical protein CH063_14410 [Colletotrichum higginsianum]|uniref:GrpE protein homolog, mitochondrial n=1 Tax=Colletotrichum higginsianum (strain IMI 349063) TaxID=759273 RepID=H1VYG4_COLHI|nr:hypothetical protein CH063_14410 [Colletotrichum higginsianum]
MAPQPDKEDNTVFHVQQKGFKLNGRVLRAAKWAILHRIILKSKPQKGDL